MILYLDASALVKRYVAEVGSADVAELIARAAAVGTSVLSRVEVVAALAKAARMRVLPRAGATAAVRAFREDWPLLVRLQATESLLAKAASLAWDHGLRGYDAAHLAAALTWQDAVGDDVTLATYDRHLLGAAPAAGLRAWPESMP